ncbi:MAG: ATP-binding protein, partial [Bacilli bacterium]
GMINDGDKILIGLSGGKDSMALVSLLATYQKFPGKHFTIAAAHLDFGFPPIDFKPVEEYVKSLGVPYIAYDASDIYGILQAHRNPVTHLLPCSICSRMRKAVINKAAKELGFHKVAFAHHMDDAIETLFLNMTFGARVATFEPKMYLENADIEFIRPLIYAREKMLLKYTTLSDIPVAKNSCGNDKHTEREDVKETLANYYKKHPDAYNNFAVMLTNDQQFKLFFDRYGAHIQNHLVVKRCSTMNDALDIGYLANEEKAAEDFNSAASFYYLLRKDDQPLGYLKCLNPSDDYHYQINSLVLKPECTNEEAKSFIQILERNLSMQHVPSTLIYKGSSHQDVFISEGYQKTDEGLVKNIIKSLKY